MRIRIQNVYKKYENKLVLDIDHLELKSGRIYAILGQNGAGKTTLLRILSKTLLPDSGTIYYDATAAGKMRDIAYLPQKPYVFNLTVMQNVLLGMPADEQAKAAAEDIVKQLGMTQFMNKKANSLSGGESQRVALARTLVLGKKMVLLDEPTSSIGLGSLVSAEQTIKKVNRENKCTMIIATHNLSSALRLSDEILFLRNGRVVERLSAKGKLEEELYNRYVQLGGSE